MKNKVRFLFLFFIFISIVCPHLFSIQLMEDVYLKDGRKICGIIVEQLPGKSITIEEQNGELITLDIKDIERIVKKRIPDDIGFYYIDVVFLNDGVVFKGTIVEQAPDSYLKLELENGLLLSFGNKEIWKIAKEKRITGSDRSIDQNKTKSLKLDLQVKLVLSNMDEKQGKLKEGKGEEGEAEKLKEEIEKLKQKMSELDEEKQKVVEAMAQEEERIAGVREEFKDIRNGLNTRLEEITRRAELFDSEELMKELEPKYIEMQHLISELFQKAEEASLLQIQDPRMMEIEQKRKKGELTSLIENDLWNKPAYKSQLESIVSELPPKEKKDVYKKMKRIDQLDAMGRNLIPLASLGSWKQGDYIGAAIGTGAGITGLVLFVSGISVEGYTMRLTALSYTGLGIMAGGYVFSLIKPFLYTFTKNSKLATVLGID